MQTVNADENLNPNTDDQDETGNVIDLSKGNDTLEADEFGVAKAEFIDESLTLEGPQSVISHSVTIHANSINGQIQKSDEAGRPLACGVIKNY
jgi:Cu/Zn superoxide dismutase